MRWDNLIADLSAQVENEERRERRDQVAELTRAELATIELRDKLIAHRGQLLNLACAQAGSYEGVLTELGADWLMLHTAHNNQHTVIRLSAVVTVSGIGQRAATGRQPLALNLPFNTVLRGLAQDRTWTHITTSTSGLRGRFEAIGASWCEVSNAENRSRMLITTPHILAITSVAHQQV